MSKKEEKQRENSQYDLLSREKLPERGKLKQREKKPFRLFSLLFSNPQVAIVQRASLFRLTANQLGSNENEASKCVSLELACYLLLSCTSFLVCLQPYWQFR